MGSELCLRSLSKPAMLLDSSFKSTDYFFPCLKLFKTYPFPTRSDPDSRYPPEEGYCAALGTCPKVLYYGRTASEYTVCLPGISFPSSSWQIPCHLSRTSTSLHFYETSGSTKQSWSLSSLETRRMWKLSSGTAFIVWYCNDLFACFSHQLNWEVQLYSFWQVNCFIWCPGPAALG